METGIPIRRETTRTVRESARTGDRERYLAALFAPESARHGLLALAAFNLELSRIAELVSEPMLGEIRLQWWREALDASETGVETGNPVADALVAAMRRHELPKPLVLGLIDARSFDLSGVMMPDMPALKAYVQKTAGTLFALAQRVLDAAHRDADRAAREAGLAYGLTGLLRALPVHASRGRLYLPATQFEDHGVDPARLLAGEAEEGLAAALAGLRADARAALGRARGLLAEQPDEALPAYLPLALVEPHLRALERPGHEALTEIAEISELARLARLAWAALRGRV